MSLDFPIGALWSIPLVSVRTFSLMMTAPIFGHATVPIRVRVMLGFLIALVIAPLVPSALAASASPLELGMAIGSETLIGATLGFALRLVFLSFAPLGELLSVQGGLGAASVLDPSSGVSSVVVGVLLQAFALVIFLAIDGHHEVIRGLAASFQRMPLGANVLSADLFGGVAGMGGVLFDVTARLAAPVTVVMLAANVGVGILGRAIPQLNLMALQLPANVAIILLVLGLAAGPFAGVVASTLSQVTDQALLVVLGAP